MTALSVRELRHCPTGLLAGDVEGEHFLKAFDQCGLVGFELGYLQVIEMCQSREHVIATLPYFVTTYRLDTMVTQPLLKWLLKPLQFRIASAGHPSTDIGRLDGEIKKSALDVISQHLAQKAKLVVYKMFACDLPLTGFSKAKGLPVHRLNLVHYAESMRNNRRKNIRKRLEKSAALRFEFVADGAVLANSRLNDIYSLYLQTEHKAEHAFATLPLDYFTQTAPISQYQLAFEGDRLIGFIQIISRSQNGITPSRSAAKYIGMDYQRAEGYGLYFALIIHVIESLQARGCVDLDLGVSSGYFKQLIGCEIVATHIYYRHTWPWLNALLAQCKFLLEPSKSELG